MTAARPLTSDDIDALAERGLSADEGPAIAALLVDAVENGGIADPRDHGYALGLAAEIVDSTGDLAGALALAEQSVAASEQPGFSRARLAELLFRSDREDEALEQLEILRPLLVEEDNAPYYVAESLELMGRREQAHEWLTEALTEALAHAQSIEEDDEDMVRATSLVFSLLQVRHRVRGELGLDHDEHDELADELREGLDELTEPGPVLFWPESEYAELLRRWPYETETFTPSWDIHRTMVETELQAWADAGNTGLSVIPGTVADLVSFIERTGATVVDEDVQLDYLDELVEHSDVLDLAWPPPRNGPCWCGSGAKYKKCCLPRPR